MDLLFISRDDVGIGSGESIVVVVSLISSIHTVYIIIIVIVIILILIVIIVTMRIPLQVVGSSMCARSGRHQRRLHIAFAQEQLTTR